MESHVSEVWDDFENDPEASSSTIDAAQEAKIYEPDEMFQVIHCLGADLLKLFGYKHTLNGTFIGSTNPADDSGRIMYLPPMDKMQKLVDKSEQNKRDQDKIEKLKKQIRQFKDYQHSSDDDSLKYLNLKPSLVDDDWEKHIDKLIDKGTGEIDQVVTEYFHHVNESLKQLKVNSMEDGYERQFQAAIGDVEVKVSLKASCDKWLEINNNRLVQNSFKEVMLPSLVLFSILTLILYFISMYTDREHMKKCKKNAVIMKSSFKRSVRDSVRNSASRFNSRINSTHSREDEPTEEDRFFNEHEVNYMPPSCTRSKGSRGSRNSDHGYSTASQRQTIQD